VNSTTRLGYGVLKDGACVLPPSVGSIIWEFAPKRYLEISCYILRYLEISLIEDISRISFMDIKGYHLDMKGFPFG
jgi:hypothetical protein